MSAVIHLDTAHAHFTNLDHIAGRVVVNLPSETAIAGIQVKLEGESRTRLSGPRYPNQEHSDKKRTELEVHKVRSTSSLSYCTMYTVKVEAPLLTLPDIV